MKKLVSMTMICAAWAMASPAQEVVGRSTVDGQQVELLSDNTWRLAETTPLDADCSAIEAGLTFCGSRTRFKVLRPPSPDIDRFYTVDDQNYAMLIVEGFGTALGLSEDGMADIILQNAVAGASVDVADVKVLEDIETEVAGLPARQLVYGLRISGLPFVFYNSYRVGLERSLQVITYVLASEPTEPALALHQEFLSGVRLD